MEEVQKVKRFRYLDKNYRLGYHRKKPLPGKQYGLFANLVSGSFGEVTFTSEVFGHSHVRAKDVNVFYGWIQANNIPLCLLGNAKIKEIEA